MPPQLSVLADGLVQEMKSFESSLPPLAIPGSEDIRC